jgi:hypothetical protein
MCAPFAHRRATAMNATVFSSDDPISRMTDKHEILPAVCGPQQPAHEKHGDWPVLPAAGAIIRVKGAPHVVELPQGKKTSATLWRWLQSMKD